MGIINNTYHDSELCGDLQRLNTSPRGDANLQGRGEGEEAAEPGRRIQGSNGRGNM